MGLNNMLSKKSPRIILTKSTGNISSDLQIEDIFETTGTGLKLDEIIEKIRHEILVQASGSRSFKVGDWVKVVGETFNGTSYYGQTYKVSSIKNPRLKNHVLVKNDILSFEVGDLKLTETPETEAKKAFKVGDVIVLSPAPAKDQSFKVGDWVVVTTSKSGKKYKVSQAANQKGLVLVSDNFLGFLEKDIKHVEVANLDTPAGTVCDYIGPNESFRKDVFTVIGPSPSGLHLQCSSIGVDYNIDPDRLSPQQPLTRI